MRVYHDELSAYTDRVAPDTFGIATEDVVMPVVPMFRVLSSGAPRRPMAGKPTSREPCSCAPLCRRPSNG